MRSEANKITPQGKAMVFVSAELESADKKPMARRILRSEANKITPQGKAMVFVSAELEWRTKYASVVDTASGIGGI